MDRLCGGKSNPNPDGHEFVLQTTPSSRSTCYNCEEAIQLGSVRFGIWSAHDELDWLKIWRFRHIDCVTSSEIEQALTVYETVQGIPTLIKQGLGDISKERREECNVILSCTLNGEPQPEDVVQRLNANPDQHVWDLLEDAKSRRIRTPGSKKQDKFNAAKAAIDSVRDEATGQFDVNEALSILTSKKTKSQTKSKPRAKKIQGQESSNGKKRARKRKAEVTGSPDGASEAEQPLPPSKRFKKKKANIVDKARKVRKAMKAKKKSSSDNAGSGHAPPQAGGGGSGGGGGVKEEQTDGTATIKTAAPASASGGAGPTLASNVASTPAVAVAADVKVEATSSSNSGVADSAYTGPRTRSRSKRSRP